MLFAKSIKKVLAERGYRHCASDDELSVHGEYARNLQYAFSKEFENGGQKVVDIIFLAADLNAEKLVIGFFRENVAIENGMMQNSSASIPLAKFSIEEFEKQLDRLIPKGSPIRKGHSPEDKF